MNIPLIGETSLTAEEREIQLQCEMHPRLDERFSDRDDKDLLTTELAITLTVD